MRACVVSLVVCALAASAAAHGGGGYRGPVPAPPPDSAEPSDPPFPPLDWTTWWADAKAESEPRRTEEDRAPVRRAVVAHATERLRDIVRDEARNFRVRAAAMTALGRIGDEAVVAFAEKIALADAESVRRELREAATLALGRLGGDDAAVSAFLADVVRRAPPDASNVRPLAALALGLRRDASRETTRVLLDALARPDCDTDTKPACLLALGLVGDGAAKPVLAAIVRDGRPTPDSEPASDFARACAYRALARLDRSSGSEFELLCAPLRPQSGLPNGVRRTAAATIGRLARDLSADRRREAVVLLAAVADDVGSDWTERRMALVSLGRLGSASDPRNRASILAMLARHLDHDSDEAAPFAATAIAWVEETNAYDKIVGIDNGRLASSFVERWAEREKRESVRSAFLAVAGPPPEPRSEDDLIAALRGAANTGSWFAAAAALGRDGDERAVPALLAALRDDAPAGAAAALIDALGRLGAKDDGPPPYAADGDCRLLAAPFSVVGSER